MIVDEPTFRFSRIILLLGSGRSGTTWLANILNTHPGVVYTHEPFTRLYDRPEVRPLVDEIKATGSLGAGGRSRLMSEFIKADADTRRPPFFAKSFRTAPTWLMYALWAGANKSAHLRPLYTKLGSPGRGSRPELLIKEVDWAAHARSIVSALDPVLIVIFRHPCAVAASQLRGERLGLMQRDIRAEWLTHFGSSCAELGIAPRDVERMNDCEFLGLRWLLTNLAYVDLIRADDASYCLTHEALCGDPLTEARRLFEFLDWERGPATRRFINQSTRAEGASVGPALEMKQSYFGIVRDPIQARDSWKDRLKPDEVEAILSVIRPHFPFDALWGERVSTGGCRTLVSRAVGDSRRRLAPGRTTAAPAVVSVPLVIHAADRSAASQPVAAGVPFARGALRNQQALQLVDAGGRALPTQVRTLAYWSDGSVKWALVDSYLERGTLEAVDSDGRSGYLRLQTVVGESDETTAGGVIETSTTIGIEAGHLWMEFDRRGSILAGLSIGGRAVFDTAGLRAVLTDRRGKVHSPTVQELAVEAHGPVRTTVRVSGQFGRGCPLQFRARVNVYPSLRTVGVQFSLHNPERARHRGGLWDLGDPGSVLFQSLELTASLAGTGPIQLAWSAETDGPLRTGGPAGMEIYQDSSGGEQWNSRNHVDRLGRVACSFRGYRERAGESESFGHRASPTVAMLGAGGGITVAVPDFWQQFPKAIAAAGPAFRVGLFPREFGELFELQGGERKRHDVWMRFEPPGAAVDRALDWVHRPARIAAAPDWCVRTGAIPMLPATGTDASAALDSELGKVVRGDRSFFARREVIDEYGWRHYGEIYADHENAYYTGPKPVISHFNNQYDVLQGFILQYLRTGDPAWFDLLDPLARHVADIDIYHTKRDRPNYNGGPFWHTDHYRDAATCTHRAFSRANRPADGSGYGGGPCAEHNYTTGLLHYYYLTGDADARAAVIELADWVVALDDGGRNLLGLVDRGPTGNASRTRERNYYGPGRGSGNSVNALLDGWLASGDAAYLATAESLIRRTVHPSDEIAGLNLLAIEDRWSYTVFLSSLARYLALKAEADRIDDGYAYGRACLLHYAAWMAEHERPYFDRPEELEFPTETWAAQELRKANVLRYAAGHADEPLRGRLLARGTELADRAWSDLLRFESRGVARAVAILMREGTVDAAFRSGKMPSGPWPSTTNDFGTPVGFVGQRERVRALLTSPAGLARRARAAFAARRRP
jgi:hypothetical protein